MIFLIVNFVFIMFLSCLLYIMQWTTEYCTLVRNHLHNVKLRKSLELFDFIKGFNFLRNQVTSLSPRQFDIIFWFIPRRSCSILIDKMSLGVLRGFSRIPGRLKCETTCVCLARSHIILFRSDELLWVVIGKYWPCVVTNHISHSIRCQTA